MAALLKSLQADNVFSYKNLYIEFDKDNITQVLAPNGYGKTNIINALLEGLYGNNPRGYKKGDIPNSITGSPNYYIKVNFEVDGVPYSVITDRRGAKLNLTLESEGFDLSCHTSKDTYKEIQELIGVDYSLACSLIYQSATTSMEFLSATDAARKKYLLNLLNLSKYTDKLESIKSAHKEEEDNLKKIIANRTSIAGQIEVKKSIYDNLVERPYSAERLNFLAQRQLDIVAELEEQKISNTILEDSYRRKLAGYISESKAYNEYKLKESSARKIIDNHSITNPMPEPRLFYRDEEVAILRDNRDKLLLDASILETRVSTATSNLAILERELQSLKATMPKTKCHVCSSDLGTEDALRVHLEKIEGIQGNITSAKEGIARNWSEAQALRNDIPAINKSLLDASNERKNLLAVQNRNIAIEQENTRNIYALAEAMKVINSLVEVHEPVEPKPYIREDATPLISEMGKVESERASLDINRKYNQELEPQRVKLRNELNSLAAAHIDLLNNEESSRALCDRLKLLADIVKNTITFVIESSVGSLQELTNHYLQQFTGGAFQIQFKIDNDKLNVVLFNNGKEMSFYMASAGQAARISTATLLAIRNLLDTVSRNKINFLMLDEVLGVLDHEGKEALFEILSKEEDMNIFLVSHEYSHPLFAKVELKKDAQGCTYIEEA